MAIEIRIKFTFVEDIDWEGAVGEFLRLEVSYILLCTVVGRVSTRVCFIVYVITTF